MKKIKISVIIPVYNADKFIEKLINSLINQTLKNMEFIFINDGSIDNSLKILKKYEKIDSRIKIISKKNEGVSKARNEGLKVAIGEYIGFCDADDFVELCMYEDLYKAAQKIDADIVSSGYKKYYNDNQTIIFLNSEKKLLNKKEAIQDVLNNGLLGMSVCNKIFKKSILKEIFFLEKIKSNEDRMFLFMSVLNSNKILVIDKSYYYYRMNDLSTSHEIFNLKFMDGLKISIDMKNIIIKYFPDLENEANANIINVSFFLLTKIYKENLWDRYKNERTKLIVLIKNNDLNKLKYKLKKSVYWQIKFLNVSEVLFKVIRFIINKLK